VGESGGSEPGGELGAAASLSSPADSSPPAVPDATSSSPGGVVRSLPEAGARRSSSSVAAWPCSSAELDLAFVSVRKGGDEAAEEPVD
jgi:hypothetical protein